MVIFWINWWQNVLIWQRKTTRKNMKKVFSRNKTEKSFKFIGYVIWMTKWQFDDCLIINRQLLYVQLNKYETDPYFLQLFQSNTTFCLIIHVFCKSCEHEIVFVLICTLAEQFHVRKSYKMRESTLLCIGNFEENIDLSHIHLAKFLGNMAFFP